MSDWTVREVDGDRERTCATRSEAEDIKADMEQLGLDVEIVPPGNGDTLAGDGGTEVVDTPDADPRPETVDTSGDRMLDMEPKDLLNIEAGWMVDTFRSGGDTYEDLSKDGCQVLATLLNQYPDAELLEYDTDDSETRYAVAKATITDPETGEQFSAHGEAWSDEQNVNSHEVIRQAETRAKKRCVKWVSAGGAKLIQMHGDD
jgi:hypothetical protein